MEIFVFLKSETNSSFVGKLRIVNFLIDECGIDPDLRNGQLETPLYLAVLHKRIAVAAYLSKVKNFRIE